MYTVHDRMSANFPANNIVCTCVCMVLANPSYEVSTLYLTRLQVHFVNSNPFIPFLRCYLQ